MTAIVLVPEAAVNEDDGTMFRKDQVRGARKVPSVKTETVSELMYETSDNEFRTSIHGPDLRHNGASLGGWVPVGHLTATFVSHDRHYASANPVGAVSVLTRIRKQLCGDTRLHVDQGVCTPIESASGSTLFQSHVVVQQQAGRAGRAGRAGCRFPPPSGSSCDEARERIEVRALDGEIEARGCGDLCGAENHHAASAAGRPDVTSIEDAIYRILVIADDARAREGFAHSIEDLGDHTGS